MTGYGSVRGGKWHRTLSAEPTFMHEEQSLCGLVFTPLNVAWDKTPQVLPEYMCQKCERMH